MEFGRRLAVEREVEKTPAQSYSNASELPSETVSTVSPTIWKRKLWNGFKCVFELGHAHF